MAEMETATAAVFLFKKNNYHEVGMVPGYSLQPDSSERRDGAFLYKDLNQH